MRAAMLFRGAPIRFALLGVLAILLPWAGGPARAADDEVRTVAPTASRGKPLSRAVKRGLAWLAEHQSEDGSWTAGEAIRPRVAITGPRRRSAATEPASLGDTCVAALALIRSGSAPDRGPHGRPVLRAVLRVCAELEEAPAEGLRVVTPSGTGSRIQGKLGTYVDTFLTALLLAETKGRMPTRGGEAMLDSAMRGVIARIEKGQREDGSYGGRGWANALSQALAAKGVNRYLQAGGTVDERVLARMEKAALARYDSRYGRFDTREAAGVHLYAAAANLAVMQETANTFRLREATLRRRARDGRTAAERAQAKNVLERYHRNEKALESARRSVLKQIGNRQFLAGFGTNGGEEFLSYMNIGEALRAHGGRDWTRWDRTLTESLERAQNPDGSWTGSHCITGRTFCTSAALLTLMADRTPVPRAVTPSDR